MTAKRRPHAQGVSLRPGPDGVSDGEATTGDATVPALRIPLPGQPAPGVEEPVTGDPRALLAEARRLSDTGHPSAQDAWRRADAAVRQTGTTLPQGEQAELADHRAMDLARTEPAAGAARFTEAAALYDAAGEPGRAVACRARAALATGYAGSPEDALTQLHPLCAQAVDLHRAGQLSTRHATAVLLSRARVRGNLLETADDPAQAAAVLDGELADLIALAEPDREQPAVVARIADATESRGRLAAQRGDAPTAARHLATAADLYREAGRTWHAAGAELAHAQALLDDERPAEAEAALRRALDAGDATEGPGAARTARLHLALAEALAYQERAAEEAGALQQAVQWAEAAGDGAGLGTHARLRLGGTYLALDCPAYAVTTLRDALPQLLAGHDEADVVQARWWLGEALARTGEHAAAAGEYLQAADLARAWENQHNHAVLAHLGANELSTAGQYAEAGSAYERAEDVWRGLGWTEGVVRVLRSRAWLAMTAHPEGGTTTVAKAVELVAAALTELEQGLQTATGRHQLDLQLELGRVYRQSAELLLRTASGPPDPSGDPEQNAVNRAAYQEAVLHTDQSVAVFRACGEAGAEERTSADLLAARLELALDRPTAATTRAHRVLAATPDHEEAATLLAEATAD